MKISEDRSYINLDAYTRNITEKNPKNTSTKTQVNIERQGDTVLLSKNAQRILDARKQFDSIPDVHENKIALIKSRIENGTYNIDTKKVAAKMLEDSFMNETI